MSDAMRNLRDQRNEFDSFHENVSFSIDMLKRNLNALPDQDYFLDNVTRLENGVEGLSKGIQIYDHYVIF